MIGDRVRFPANNENLVGEGVICGFVSVDGTAHAVVRSDEGRYRSIVLLRLERIPTPAPSSLQAYAEAASCSAL